MHICTHTQIRICSLVCMRRVIVFLLFARTEQLDSTKKTTQLRNEDFSRYAVASLHELDRKHVVIGINGLSFSNGTFASREDGFITYPNTSVAMALECVRNEFNTCALYFSRINSDARLCKLEI